MATATSTRVLTTSLRGSSVRDLALVVAGAAFIAVSAQVSIPLPFSPVPVTGQTFAVLLTGAALGASLGVAATGLYLAAALAGLPVLAPTETGGHLISPLPGVTATVPGSCTLPLPGIMAAIVDETSNVCAYIGRIAYCVAANTQGKPDEADVIACVQKHGGKPASFDGLSAMDQVRLIGSAGEQLGTVPLPEALRIARESELDLVEVAAAADRRNQFGSVR